MSDTEATLIDVNAEPAPKSSQVRVRPVMPANLDRQTRRSIAAEIERFYGSRMLASSRIGNDLE